MVDWQAGLYVLAVLVPLAAFVVELLAGRWFKEKNAYIATGAIGFSFLLSLVGFIDYFAIEAPRHPVAQEHANEAEGPTEHEKAAEGELGGGESKIKPAPVGRPLVWKARFDWVDLGQGVFSSTATSSDVSIGLEIPWEISIDGLSAIMFLMVTLIATLIHVYSIGYMHGDKRYPRFFTYLSLFCFSMLALLGVGQSLHGVHVLGARGRLFVLPHWILV